MTPVAACRLCGGSDLVTVLDLGDQAAHRRVSRLVRRTSAEGRSSSCGARRARSFSSRTATSPPRCTATTTATGPA